MSDKPSADIDKLRELIARLRAPEGCPWDREQTLADVRAYLLEEAHEVAAAIDGDDRAELAGELGDLLFQVVFIAHLAHEEGAFDLADVIDLVHAKMIERHPHVFGPPEADHPRDAAAVRRHWERRKLAAEDGHRSLLAGVPPSLPALTGAYRITQKAAGVGFDWPDAAAVLTKVREELAEVEEVLGRHLPASPATAERDAVVEEIGDLLFAVANLARHLEIDPEAALARGNLKFRRRFEELETSFAARGRSLVDSDLAELDAEWDAVKDRERRGPGEAR